MWLLLFFQSDPSESEASLTAAGLLTHFTSRSAALNCPPTKGLHLPQHNAERPYVSFEAVVVVLEVFRRVPAQRHAGLYTTQSGKSVLMFRGWRSCLFSDTRTHRLQQKDKGSSRTSRMEEKFILHSASLQTGMATPAAFRLQGYKGAASCSKQRQPHHPPQTRNVFIFHLRDGEQSVWMQSEGKKLCRVPPVSSSKERIRIKLQKTAYGTKHEACLRPTNEGKRR